MSLFDDILPSGQSLIKNEAALDYEFLPKILPFRESEQQYLATCIKPLFQQRSGRNLVIHGPPGIGKTAATKHVLRELEEQTDAIEIIYVNCWKANSTFKVLCEIAEQVGYKFTQNKKTTELFKIVANIVNKSSAVFVFDEIDKAEDFDFLYFILEEVYKKAVFLITNYMSWSLNLDERIKSRLMAELVQFRQYTDTETAQILKGRAGYAFPEGIWEQDAFDAVCRKAAQVKDIRSGLFLMKESALLAEEKSLKKISMEQVERAIRKLDEFTVKDKADLEEELKFILQIVKGNSGKRIGDLFRLYQKEGGKVSYKTFQRKIASLEESKFISTEKQTGSEGNTTIVNKSLSDY
ncbi:MAG: AAA family ATPase [Nanoarchaeota archaeon]